MGVGIVQGLGASNLTASYFYAPNATNLGGGDTGTSTNTTGDNAAYEYGVKGNDVFGVKGLGLEYWKNQQHSLSHQYLIFLYFECLIEILFQEMSRSSYFDRLLRHKTYF